MKALTTVFISLVLLAACEKSENLNNPYFENSYECQENSANRIGARCKDGTRSKSTGRGTCSHHGGVEVWLCK